MPEKDPGSYSLVTYTWVFLLALMGGLVNFFHRLKRKKSTFNGFEFIGELITAAFTGVITFWLCETANVPQILTAAIVGISGHMGSRAILLIEKTIKRRLEQ